MTEKVRQGNTLANTKDPIDFYKRKGERQNHEANFPVREATGTPWPPVAVQAVDSSEDDVFPTQPRPAQFPESHYEKGVTTLRDNEHWAPREANTSHAKHPEVGRSHFTQRGPVPRIEVENAKPREKAAPSAAKKQLGSPSGQR